MYQIVPVDSDKVLLTGSSHGTISVSFKGIGVDTATFIFRPTALVIVDITLSVNRHREDCRQHESEVFENCHVVCYCVSRI